MFESRSDRLRVYPRLAGLLLAPAIVLAPAGALGAPGGEESAGNNLSFPVIWSDGVAKALRGVYGAPVFLGEYFLDASGVAWYLQQDEANAWQAEGLDSTGIPVSVDEIDWGDNLEAKDWTTNSVVRVETVLYQDVSATPMLGFEMQQLWGSGVDEMWGTNTVEYLSGEATVYSHCARLTIQKLQGSRDDPPALDWDADAGAWYGEIEAPAFIGGVWEAGDGPGYYSAEINIPGKVIYGYNWFVRRLTPDETAGDYRITFSLAPQCGVLNTYFDEQTLIRQPVEEDGEEAATVAEEPEDPGGDTGGGVAVVRPDLNLTYIDVRIVQATGGGGGGQGGPGGAGGGPPDGSGGGPPEGGGGGKGQGGPRR